MPHAVMLFAAGFGTRMAPLTDDRPKPLIEVAGKPLLDHALTLTEDPALQITHRVVNAHYRAEQIRDHLTERADITVVEEHPEILDTGGGLRAALPLLGGHPVITLNTDAVWTGQNPLATLIDHWQPEIMDALLLLIPLERATGHKGQGDFQRDTAGRLTRGPGLVYGGTQIVKTGDLASVPEPVFSLNLLWDTFGRNGRLFGVAHTGGWCDVGHPAAIPLAEDLLASDSGDVC